MTILTLMLRTDRLPYVALLSEGIVDRKIGGKGVLHGLQHLS
jgi:hypothetical protein